MKKLSSMFFAFLLLGVTAAQPRIVISPQSIVVNPLPSFEVDVFTDRDTTGDASPSYQIGENISVGVRVSEDAYVYLFNVRSNGVVDQILPNRLDQNGENNFVRAGQTKYFPPQNAGYNFQVDGPRGLDKVIAVASKNTLNTSQLARFNGEEDFASSSIGESGFADTLSIIVRPIDQDSWVTDTALFYVGSRPSAPIYGSLNINSTPSGAEAYVDGQFVGYTPVRYGTRSGSRNVEVRLNGYETFNTSVNVQGGQRTPVNANLRQVVRSGTVSFNSNPSGATVSVNGQDYGSTPTGAITLDAGTYDARFSRNGYSDTSIRFTVNAGDDQDVNATLEAREGSVNVRANVGGASVFINGQEVGTVPNGTGLLNVGNLPSGSHELVVIAPGFRSHLSEFQVRGGQTTDVRVSQTRR